MYALIVVTKRLWLRGIGNSVVSDDASHKIRKMFHKPGFVGIPILSSFSAFQFQ